MKTTNFRKDRPAEDQFKQCIERIQINTKGRRIQPSNEEALPTAKLPSTSVLCCFDNKSVNKT